MRKGAEAQRFPQSALLFRFCLRVLETRKLNEKVHDQAVGNILQYNPSDTSHWKRGKKAVRSIYALDALSQTLDVDIDTIQDLADGLIDFEEAWFDFLEAEEYRRTMRELNPEMLQERRQRQRQFDKLAADLLAKANISSIPVYLPELLQVLPFIQLAQGDVAEKLVRTSRIKPGQYAVRYRKGELRAHTRAAITREISRVVMYSEREQFGLPSRQDALTFLEVIDFSNALLVPTDLLISEMQKVPARMNLIKRLSEIFWVPKAVIRERIATVVLDKSPESVFSASKFPMPSITSRKVNMAELSEDDSSSKNTSTTMVEEGLETFPEIAH